MVGYSLQVIPCVTCMEHTMFSLKINSVFISVGKCILRNNLQQGCGGNFFVFQNVDYIENFTTIKFIERQLFVLFKVSIYSEIVACLGISHHSPSRLKIHKFIVSHFN